MKYLTVACGGWSDMPGTAATDSHVIFDNLGLSMSSEPPGSRASDWAMTH